MRFKRWTFSWKSPLLGFHIGENPVSGQRFVHIAPFPFIGLDFNLPPYGLNDAAREQLGKPDIQQEPKRRARWFDLSPDDPTDDRTWKDAIVGGRDRFID